MRRAFNRSLVLSDVAGMAPQERLAFALSCVERMIPNYRYFQKKYDWGDSEVLLEAAEIAWLHLAGTVTHRRRVEEVVNKCEQVLPDTEDFDSIYVSSALDAGVACIELLNFVLASDISLVATIAELCIDSVDMYVQELEEMDAQHPNLEGNILTHPLMQAELERQANDRQLLLGRAAGDTSFSVLEMEWRNPSSSLLGLA